MMFATAALMRSSGITLPRNVVASRRRKTLIISAQSAQIVVVFNPPPVPEGDAPIIMTKVSKNNELAESAAIGIVLKPTVVLADIT